MKDFWPSSNGINQDEIPHVPRRFPAYPFLGPGESLENRADFDHTVPQNLCYEASCFGALSYFPPWKYCNTGDFKFIKFESGFSPCQEMNFAPYWLPWERPSRIASRTNSATPD